MTENNGWPGKPGVPLNPERDGWHWLMCPLKHDLFPRFWRAAGEAHNCRWTAKWLYSRNDWNPKECTYLGPCLTPAEVDARAQQAQRDALEEAAQEMDCACPQRGAVLAKLEKDGPLSHHWPCEKSDDCCALRGAAIRALKG